MSVWNWFVSVTLVQSPQQAGRQASGQMHLRDQNTGAEQLHASQLG